MAKDTAIGKKIRVAVVIIGMWVLLLDAVIVLAMLVKGVPRPLLWRAGHYVPGPVPWTSQDTAILTVLLLLQPSVFIFYKVWREDRTRAKTGPVE